MANEKHDGGPAFPNQAVMGSSATADGMTLRDFFAAFSMLGQIAHNKPVADYDADDVARMSTEDIFKRQEAIAAAAYSMADAMLAARAAGERP